MKKKRNPQVRSRVGCDLSVPVNAMGVSKKIKAELRKNLKNLGRYPDPDCVLLKKEISRKLAVSDDQIVCGNGSTEISRILIETLRPVRILLAPGSDHLEKILPGNSTAELVHFKEENLLVNPCSFAEALRGCDMAFLSNPCFYSGIGLGKDQLLEIARVAEGEKCFFVIDESNIDFVPEKSLAGEVSSFRYLSVLRSFSNFYSLAGLRIGYGIFNRSITDLVQKTKYPWSVNSLAQKAAVTALRDNQYRKETVKLLGEERVYLEKQLCRLGIGFHSSETDYFLVFLKEAEELYNFLLKSSIVVLSCREVRGFGEGFLRISIGSHQANTRLVKAVKEFREYFQRGSDQQDFPIRTEHRE